MFELVTAAQMAGERIGQEIAPATVAGAGVPAVKCKIGALTFHEQLHAGGGGLDVVQTMDVAILRADAPNVKFTRGQQLTVTRKLYGGTEEAVQLEVGDMNMDDAVAIYLNLVRPIV